MRDWFTLQYSLFFVNNKITEVKLMYSWRYRKLIFSREARNVRQTVQYVSLIKTLSFQKSIFFYLI